MELPENLKGREDEPPVCGRTGGHAYHGPYEHDTAEGMDLAVRVIKEILSLYVKQ